MRKATSTLLILLLACALRGHATIDHLINFSDDKLSFSQVTKDGKNYTSVQYSGMDNNGEIGGPSVPQEVFNFCLPSNATNITVTYNLGNSKSYKLDSGIERVDSGFTSLKGGLDQIFIGKSKLADLTNVSYVGGGNKIATVKVQPIAVSTSNDSIVVFYSSITLHINYESGDDEGITPLSTYSSTTAQENYNFMKNDIPNFVDSYCSTGVIQGGQIAPLTTDQQVYKYIIITPARFTKSFERLAAMRRAMGVGAEVFALESILNSSRWEDGDKSSGIKDDAGKLREFLKYAYSNYGTKYVLFAGKYPEMPLRLTTDPTQISTEIYNRIPSDFYFSELNNNWKESKITNVYQTINTTPDLISELYIGRLNVTSQQEIDNYIERLKLYEFNSQGLDDEYLNSALLTIQDDDDDIYLFISTAEPTLQTLYEQESLNVLSATNDKTTGKSVIDFWNNNPAGMQCIVGHGNPGGIAVSSKEFDEYTGYYGIVCKDDKEHYHIGEVGNGLDCLTIKDKPSWAFSIGCHVMPNDYLDDNGTPYDYHYHFGDALTIAYPSGAVAFLGNTRASWNINGTKALSTLYKNIRNSKDSDSYVQLIRAGEIQTKSMAFGGFGFHETLIRGLIGDPLVPLWTAKPKSIIVTKYEDENKYSIQLDAEEKGILCSAPLIDRTYAATSEINAEELANFTPRNNNNYTIYSKNSRPTILPLTIDDFPWYSYSNQYIFANEVNIALESEVNIYHMSTPTIEAMGDVHVGTGLYIHEGGTLTILSDKDVYLDEIRMGKNTTLKVVANRVFYEKGFVHNDGMFTLDITERTPTNHAPKRPQVKQNEEAALPFVEEGKTWWYVGRLNNTTTEISPERSSFFGYAIGSEEEVDGKMWHRLYGKYLRYITETKELVEHKYTETDPEVFQGYIREEDGKVYTRGCGMPGFVFRFGAYFTMMMEEPMIYDFSRSGTSYQFGHPDFDIHFTRIDDKIIEQNNRSMHSYTYHTDSEHIIESGYNPSDYEMVEGVGIIDNNNAGHFYHLFHIPFGVPFTSSARYYGRPVLTYVTDADNNILFTNLGGPKPWELMDGVEGVTVESAADGPAQWFDLNGREIAEPTAKGIYLLRRGTSVTKVMR